MKTLYQTCVIICITMLVFTLAINFVSGLGIFAPYSAGVGSGGSTDDTFNATTNTSNEGSFGMDAVWGMIFGGAAIGAIVVAGVTRSPIIIGVYIFSVVFWVAYLNTLTVIQANDWIPAGFLLMGTTLMVFVFAGAVIGMLSGSG